MKQTEYRFPSATGVCEIAARSYLPDDGSFNSVLVINHGMAEHQKRYERFIDYLCVHGMAVYMHDMANHGMSITDFAQAGWFGERDGYKGLIADFRSNIQKAKLENPGKKIIVMGHSMGSFICRLYTAWYPDDGVDGVIFMGTGGPNSAAGAGKMIASLIPVLKGKKHRSQMLDTLAFGSYLKECEKRTPFDWLTRDTSIVDSYIRDQYCGFRFPVQGMIDLLNLNIESNKDEWFSRVPKELPILVISGEKDPVGDYGKGIETICRKLAETGHIHLTKKIYPECRHEILNELNKEEVMSDIVKWIGLL